MPKALSHNVPNAGFSLNVRNVAAKLAFHYLLSGLGEEPLFRGLIIVILLKSWTGEVKVGKIRMPVAGLWATLLFMLAHINYTLVPFKITHFSLFQQMLCLGYGLFYAALFYRTGSLLGPILSHGVSNGIPFTLIYLTVTLAHPQSAAPKGRGGAVFISSPPVAEQVVTVNCLQRIGVRSAYFKCGSGAVEAPEARATVGAVQISCSDPAPLRSGVTPTLRPCPTG